MTIDTQSRLLALDFRRDIERLTEDFSGREWLFKEIDDWLLNQDQRFFILTGEPGAGKSAIAARLTQVRRENTAAYHFCIAGNIGTITPNTVLRSLAAQLGESLPGYGEALANTIKPHQVSINVKQEIGKIEAGAKVVGVAINHLYPTDPEEELDILLRAPLAALAAPKTPIFILIDSLDEAMTYQGQTNLITLLAKTHDLPAWVRFVCTTRSEEAVLSYFEMIKPHVLIGKKDIEKYVALRFCKKTMRSRLRTANFSPRALANRVGKLADGNFLFTKILLNDIESGRQSLDDLDALPKGLDGVYHSFLRRFSDEDWDERYQPILGMLAVVREPIGEKQLANFTDMRQRQIRRSLAVVGQYLDVVEDGSDSKSYRLFHQSLQDYLLDEKRSEMFWCDPEEENDQIAEFYLKTFGDRWEQCDAYGLRNLATHLMAAGNRQDLYELISKPWLDAQLSHFGDYRFFFDDIDLAIQAALQETPPDLVQMARQCLIHSQLMTTAPPVVIAVLAQAGQTARARSLAGNITFALDRCLAYSLLAQNLARQDDLPAVQECLQEAQRNLPAIEGSHHIMAMFWIVQAALAAGDRALAEQLAQNALQIALHFEPAQVWDHPNALFWASKILRTMDDQEGLAKIRQLVSDREMNPLRNLVLQTMSVAGDVASLEAIAKTRLSDEHSSIRLSNLALALADAGLDQLCEQALAAIEAGAADHGGADTPKRSVWALAILGHFERALEKVTRIEEPEEQVKALAKIVELAGRGKQPAVVRLALAVADSLADTDDWRILSRLAPVYLEGGQVNRAVELADTVCAMNIQPTLDNTLTMSHRRAAVSPVAIPPATDVEAGSDYVFSTIINVKTDRRPLETTIKPVADQILVDEVIQLAKKGAYQEALKQLELIKVPAFRAQALRVMAQHLVDGSKKVQLWSRALQEARWAGQNVFEEVLNDGETILSQAAETPTWVQIQEMKLKAFTWWS